MPKQRTVAGRDRSRAASELSRLVLRRKKKEASEVLRLRWRELLDEGETDIVGDAMELVPLAERQSAWFMALDGRIAIDQGKEERGIALLRTAHGAALGTARTQIGVDLMLASFDAGRSDVQDICEISPRSRVVAIVATFAASKALHQISSGSAALASIESALKAVQQSGDTAAVATILLMRARAQRYLGDTAAAISSANDAIDVVRGDANVRIEIDAHCIIMDAAAASDDRALRDDCANEIVTLCKQRKHTSPKRRAMIVQVQSAMDGGCFARAAAIATELFAFGLPDRHPSARIAALSIAANALVRGDSAEFIAETMRLKRTGSLSQLLGRAMASAVASNVDQTERRVELNAIRGQLRASISTGRYADDLWCTAWTFCHVFAALRELGLRREAKREAATLRNIARNIANARIRLLCVAFALAGGDGNVRRAQGILEKAGYKGVAGYLGKLVPETNVPRLTPRQRLCISLVAHDYSRQQVANELGIATCTVDTHLAIAYKRLGQAGTSPIARARDLGLIYALDVALSASLRRK